MRRLLSLLSIVFLPVAFAQTTVTKNPTGDGTPGGSSTSWSGSAGSRYTLVDDYPDGSTGPADILVSPTSTCSTACYMPFTYTAFSIPSTATSISVSVVFYNKEGSSGSNNSQGLIVVGGTNYYTGSNNPSTTWTLRRATWTTNPKTSAAWTPAQINGTDGTNPLTAFGFYSTDSSPAIDYASVQIQVTYSHLTAAIPTCTPGAGTYTSVQSVTCSSTTTGSTTYCTIDGSTPTTGSPTCSSISVASTATLKAISAATGYNNSAEADVLYTINITPAVNALDGKTIGSSSGNMSGWDTKTLGVSSGNICAWNGYKIGSGCPSAAPILVQHATRFNCTTASCAVTTSSTAAGSLLVLYSSAQYAGTGYPTVGALTGVTDNGTSETWTHCPNSMVNDSFNTNGKIHATDCYYILSAAGGATTVTAAWAFSGLTSPSYKVDAEVFEYSYTGTIYYDTGNAILTSAGCTNCTGPSGLLDGTADVVLQSAYVLHANRSVNSVSSPYSTALTTDTSSNALYAAFAAASAQASYSQPTWTLSGATGEASMYSFAAFGFNSSPAKTGNLLTDFSACSSGIQPTATCAGNSTFSGWQVTQSGMNGPNPGMTTCTSVIGTNLPSAIRINRVSITGSSTLDLCGVTSKSGTNIGYYDIDLGVSELQAQYNPLTLGFSFRSDCPANVECGAIGGLTNSGIGVFYAVLHPSPLGDGKWCLESSNGGGCQESETPFAYAPNTNYRINIQMAGLSGTVDKLTVCQDGPGGSVLGTITATSAATSYGVSTIRLGITGEEPTTSGYHYYWRNIVVGGTYSTTGCF
jgi:hypothetical protein